ncbi:MAG TPA: hypothetical protein VMR88_17865 [Candidatus Polarisedimenticolaceae bacterium]|nr:hypothetical protein [Candidatus Polarisedimenticolaceae bacterium]
MPRRRDVCSIEVDHDLMGRTLQSVNRFGNLEIIDPTFVAGEATGII